MNTAYHKKVFVLAFSLRLQYRLNLDILQIMSCLSCFSEAHQPKCTHRLGPNRRLEWKGFEQVLQDFATKILGQRLCDTHL